MLPDDIPSLLSALIAEAVREAVEPAVREAMKACLPDVIRRAALPPYLTRHQLADVTGWSLRKVDYMKAERRVPFVQRGRTVLFPTAEVEAYLDEGRVDTWVQGRS